MEVLLVQANNVCIIIIDTLHGKQRFVHYTVRTHLPSKVLAQQSGSHGDEYTIADTGQIQHSLSQHKANVE